MSYTGKKLSQVTDYVKSYICDNALENGAKLPTESEMIASLGVSRVTLRRALSNLQEDGVIYSVQGSGYYVGNVPHKSNAVPIIISYDNENSKILNIVQGAQTYLEKRGCSLDVHISRRNPDIEKLTIEELYNKGCRCAIIFPVSSEDNVDFYFHMSQMNMDLIFIDRQPSNVNTCHFVRSDNMTGGYLATRYLIEQGHKNIVMFGLESLMHTSATYERFLGYQHAMREAGLPLPQKQYYHSIYKRSNSDVEEILSPQTGITAVFAVNDYAAVDIATHAFNKGLKVPEDLSIVGFDNLNVTTMFTPHLSTVDQSFTQLGETAAEIAYKCLSGTQIGYTQRIIPVKLIPRDSSRKHN